MDRDKVIKGLEVCLKNIDQQDCPNDCPYLSDCSKYENRVVFQPLMRDALALLKEQDAVVRCKDCIYWKNETLRGNYPSWLPCMDIQTRSDFYCADGER